ncbi:hypothetical protein [Curtobacterium sp. ISL-83]|uniref:beta-sandwich lipoprotein n=1 Tax=Curtobacterium sp. ISL-83 TaxID=2819145 RepID=UPI001BE7ED7F|nr:hypothetical protein [Curtobacterium sp. ISL-83]MBT2502997.1 hypothetical protein [Curtobacterium sp. ISL-83]
MNKRTIATVAIAATAVLALAGCTSQADTVSENLSRDADSFKIHRQIVFYNGITDKYIAEVDGLCSLGNNDSSKQRTVTCKIGPDKYVKETFGLSDNTMVWSLQTEPAKADPYRYKVIFKPESIIPNIETQTSAG